MATLSLATSRLFPTILGNTTFINSLLLSTGVAVSLLSSVLQNGGSPWGRIDSPVLPQFLGGSNGNPPWGTRTSDGTNVYVDMPDTGVTRSYDFTIARATLAPDGFEKEMILINGQFPGPLIEANWGDWIQVTVHNNIAGPVEGTALHWHGLLQKETPYMDGVPGVSQCPIAPGETMVYKFRADIYGSSWYHSHYSSQLTDGAYGPMIIHGPTSAPYDLDLGPLMVSDYYHRGYRSLLDDLMSTDPVRSQTTFADNTIIQGKMNYNCSAAPAGSKCASNAGIAKFRFRSGKTHLIRIINTSTFGVMLVSIDYHIMTVIANDFVPVTPYDTKVVTLAAGQRLDVLVKGNPLVTTSNGAYFLRIRQPQLCALAFQPFGIAAIYYDTAKDTNAAPTSLPYLDFVTPRLLDCSNEALSLTVPHFPIAIASKPDATLRVDISLERNASGHFLYTMNKSSFRANFNQPSLLAAQKGDLSFIQKEQSNTYDFGSNDTIRIEFRNNVPFSHPMHIHGQNMFVLSEGVGVWDGKTIVRPENPQRRDTQLLRPNGYLVVQLVSDNPGVWPFHCHFNWHVSTGLYINVIQKTSDIKKLTAAPGAIKPVCDGWDRYSSQNIVDQIDSGVKLMA